jgi:hypothetical protein
MLLALSPAGNRLARALARLRRPAPASPPPPPVPCRSRPNLHCLAQANTVLPAFVVADPVARKYLDLLGPLDWEHFPERPTNHPWPGPPPAPRAPYVAAYLVKLNEGLRSMGHLRRYLVEHPALVWLLGFPLVADPAAPHGFDVERSLPSRRQLGRVLRELDPAAAQFLLTATVQLIRQELPAAADFGDVVAGDTKHILAWVKANNPKQYVEDRYNKARQPKGDPDCKLGCKKRRNQGEANGGSAAPAPMAGVPPSSATPTTEPTPASHATVGEFHWGYASGVIATKIPDWGEFVLAELTQTFDKSDPSYFFPLLQQVEQRLGHRPRYGAFDAAYDAFYVHQYFHEAGGFAAVPLVAKGRSDLRQFSPTGLPLCAAGLAMPLKLTFTDRTTTLITHERGKYVCPLRHAETAAGAACPVNHARWDEGGCTAMMPTCAGARLRYQLDRDSAKYKSIYHQRTATERINSQALALGIERPHLRRQSAIANQNTLIYVLINLRALQRMRARKRAERKEELARQPKPPGPANT